MADLEDLLEKFLVIFGLNAKDFESKHLSKPAGLFQQQNEFTDAKKYFDSLLVKLFEGKNNAEDNGYDLIYDYLINAPDGDYDKHFSQFNKIVPEHFIYENKFLIIKAQHGGGELINVVISALVDNGDHYTTIPLSDDDRAHCKANRFYTLKIGQERNLPPLIPK